MVTAILGLSSALLIILLISEIIKQAKEIDALHSCIEDMGRSLRRAREERDSLREQLEDLQRCRPHGGGGSKS